MCRWRSGFDKTQICRFNTMALLRFSRYIFSYILGAFADTNLWNGRLKLPPKKSKKEFTGRIQFNHDRVRIPGRRTFSKIHTYRRNDKPKIPNVFLRMYIIHSRFENEEALWAVHHSTEGKKMSLCRRESLDIWQHNNFRNYISLIKLFY